MIIVDDNDEEMVRETEESFKPYLLKKMQDAHCCNDDSKPPNPVFMPQWKDLLKSKWLAHAPFWSSIFKV